MKRLLLTLVLLTVIISSGLPQVVNQVSISPANPTVNDTLTVICDLTYYGNCTFGLVYEQSWLAGSTINILPTYCGYGDSSVCNSVDTFKAGPFANGNYNLHIEFHQGSVCPVSGFDAIISTFDTVLTVSGITSMNESLPADFKILIFPDAAQRIYFVQSDQFIASIEITNAAGELVHASKPDARETQLNLSTQPAGIYFYRIHSGKESIVSGKLIIQ